MERLTKRYTPKLFNISEDKDLTSIKHYEHLTCEAICKDRTVCAGCPVQECIEKLANYEDAEEEGWLVLFPVAIGDHIWQISPKNSIKELEIIEMSVEKDGAKYAVGRPLDNSVDVIFTLTNVEIKNNFFYTKKEAEKRLKELENEHEKIN